MITERQTNCGISSENALRITSYINDLVASPYQDRLLEPPRSIDNTFREAQHTYSSEVGKYEDRSLGYKDRLRSYETLGRLLPSAPFVHLFWRIIDDYIDGDIQCGQDEIESLLVGVANRIKGVNTNEPLVPDIMPLLEAGFTDWNTSPEEIKEVRDLALWGINHMLEDPIRAQEGRVVSQRELDTLLLHNTGSYMSQLYMALRINWRAFSPDKDKIYEPARDAARCQALMQHLRPHDLESDWNQGIKNIPSEVLVTAGLDSTVAPVELSRSRVVTDWALEKTHEAGRSFTHLALRGVIMLPSRPKAAIVIPGLSRNFYKIAKHVREAYQPR